jgi:hypothetical protein
MLKAHCDWMPLGLKQLYPVPMFHRLAGPYDRPPRAARVPAHVVPAAARRSAIARFAQRRRAAVLLCPRTATGTGPPLST